jgi:signal transduction histidine kinase
MAAAQTLADVTTAYLVNAQDRVAKVEFVAALSHELRTPMTSISGFIELLSEDPDGRLSEDQNTFLSAIRHNGERLMSLADDLLTISSLEAAAQRHMLHAVDLGKVVVQAHAAISSVIAHRGLVVTFEVPEEPVNIQGDIPNLESMVSNLVSNALKFTEDGGWVRCTLRVVDGAARLQVSDSGLGIPLAEQPDLFTRFYRSSTARAHAIQGSGLGLTIVASVVHQHGGEISFISEDEVGSTFTVNLPLAHPHSLTPLAPEPV